jgi:hypothetical protein
VIKTIRICWEIIQINKKCHCFFGPGSFSFSPADPYFPGAAHAHILPYPDTPWPPRPGRAGQTPPASRARPHFPPRGATGPAPSPSPFPPLLQCIVPPSRPFSPFFPCPTEKTPPPSILVAHDPWHAPKHLASNDSRRHALPRSPLCFG